MLHRTTPGDPVNDPEWPLPRRVGIHLLTLRTIIETYNAGVDESRRVEFDGLPGVEELKTSGLGAFLR